MEPMNSDEGIFWKQFYNYIPKDEDLRSIPGSMIALLKKSGVKGKTIAKLWNTSNVLATKQEALARLALFGDKNIGRQDVCYYSIVSYNITPDVVSLMSGRERHLAEYSQKDLRSILRNYATYLRVTEVWPKPSAELVHKVAQMEVMSVATGLDIKSMSPVEYKALVKVVSINKEGDYFKMAKDYGRVLKNRAPARSSINVQPTKVGKYSVRVIEDVVDALFAGYDVNCCQHPFGAGRECAFHGVYSENGTIVGIYYKNKLVGTSWIWKDPTTGIVCVDSIEAMQGYDAKSIVEAIVSSLSHYSCLIVGVVENDDATDTRKAIIDYLKANYKVEENDLVPPNFPLDGHLDSFEVAIIQ